MTSLYNVLSLTTPAVLRVFHAGTAVPFVIVRIHDNTVVGSTRYWNLEPGTMVMAAGLCFTRPQRAGRLWDWLHVVDALGSPDCDEYRSQDAHADTRLRSVAGTPCLLPHGFRERAVTRCPRTHRWTIRRDSPSLSYGRWLHRSWLGAIFDLSGGVAGSEATVSWPHGSRI